MRVNMHKLHLQPVAWPASLLNKDLRYVYKLYTTLKIKVKG